ncbi:MAG: hypothetical protein OXE93_04330 [bacterium]|nr:hypothetical protein [bacterium]MCY4258490.1 hypothetical protein [bacterium]
MPGEALPPADTTLVDITNDAEPVVIEETVVETELSSLIAKAMEQVKHEVVLPNRRQQFD